VNKKTLIERSVKKSRDHKQWQLTSLGIQTLAKYIGERGITYLQAITRYYVQAVERHIVEIDTNFRHIAEFQLPELTDCGIPPNTICQ
jgi:hypothetical protein